MNHPPVFTVIITLPKPRLTREVAELVQRCTQGGVFGHKHLLGREGADANLDLAIAIGNGIATTQPDLSQESYCDTLVVMSAEYSGDHKRPLAFCAKPEVARKSVTEFAAQLRHELGLEPVPPGVVEAVLQHT